MTSIGFLFNFLAKVNNTTRRLIGNILTEVDQDVPLREFLTDSCVYQEIAGSNELYGTIVFCSNTSVWYTPETDVIFNTKSLKKTDFHLIGIIGLTDYLHITPETKGFFTVSSEFLDLFYEKEINVSEDWNTTSIQDIVHTKNGQVIDYERVLVTELYEKGIMEKLHNLFKPKDIVT